MFGSIVRKFLVPGRPSGGGSRPRSARPQVETLENRLVPATFNINDTSGVAILTLQGDESVVVSHDGHGFIRIAKGGNVIAEADDVVRFDLVGSSGVNVVRYHLTDTVTEDMEINVDLGTNNDRFTGTLNHDLFARLDLMVNGGAGKDLLTLYGTPTAPARAGDSLTDGLAINQNGLRIGLGAELLVEMNGSLGHDRVFLDYDGDLDGTIRATMTGGDQNDVVSAILTLRNGSTGQLGTNASAARVEGNTGNDDLTFRVRNNSNGQALVRAQVNGGEDAIWPFDGFDNDRATHTANVVNTGGVEIEFIV